MKTVSLSIQSVSGSAIPAIWSHASAFPRVRSRHHVKKKMPATCWYLTSLPQCLGCHICFCSSTHIATAFRCYKGIYTAFYSIYAVLKCQMLPYFCFLVFIENRALRLNLSGPEAGFEKEKPSVHWYFSVLSVFSNALFWYCLGHCCTKVQCMHNNRKWVETLISCEMPKIKCVHIYLKRSLET